MLQCFNAMASFRVAGRLRQSNNPEQSTQNVQNGAAKRVAAADSSVSIAGALRSAQRNISRHKGSQWVMISIDGHIRCRLYEHHDQRVTSRLKKGGMMIRLFWLVAVGMCLALLTPAQPAAAQQIGCRLAGSLPSPVPVLPFSAERRVQISDVTLILRVCAPHAESLTAVNALNQVAQALPTLATYTDLPLRGSLERTIVIRDSAMLLARNVDGYITIDNFEINLHRLSRPSTAIHEAAHYWATVENFGDDWMVEGYAEYLTSLAAADLGVPHEPFEVIPVCEQFPLIYWNNDQSATISCAYSVGPQIFHELEARVGTATLRQELLRLSALRGGITSYDLLLALEQASDADIVAVMRGQVFGPESDAWLTQRQELRRRLLSLQPAAVRLGIPLPEVRSAIDAHAFDEAAAVLAPLAPLVEAATLVEQQCQVYGLTCQRPWAAASLTPADWPSLTAHLGALSGLLAFYGEQHNVATALDLTLPQLLRERVGAFDPQAEGQLHETTVTLNAIASLEQTCAERTLVCRPLWEDAWAVNDLAGVQQRINAALDLFARAAVTETRCADLQAICGATWQTAFTTSGIGGGQQALNELEALLRRAEALERQCADLKAACASHWRSAMTQGGPTTGQEALQRIDNLLIRAEALEVRCADLHATCRQIWRTTLEQQGVLATLDQITQLDALWQHAETIEAACVTAGWPCAAGWRSAFEAQGSAQARQILDDQHAALPVLSQLQTRFRAPQPVQQLLSIVPGQAQGSATAVVRARDAFNAGDIAAAEAILAAAAAQQASHGRTLIGSVIGIASALAILLACSMYWHRRRRRASRPVQPRPRPADTEVLANLLGTPPEQGR